MEAKLNNNDNTIRYGWDKQWNKKDFVCETKYTMTLYLQKRYIRFKEKV